MTPLPHDITIDDSIQLYLDEKASTRTANTARTYKSAMKKFREVLVLHEIDPATASPTTLTEMSIVWMIQDGTRELATASENNYLAALVNYFKYLSAEEILSLNFEKMRLKAEQKIRRVPQRLPQFPREKIERLIEYALALKDTPAPEGMVPTEAVRDHLRALRDRAMIVVLADTGLRVHELVALDRGSIDLSSHQAVIIGKGDKEDVVRFSTRAVECIADYLAERTQALDGKTGRALTSLPLFARHDRGAGYRKVKRITTVTARNSVEGRMQEALGEDDGEVHPHSLRHRFVTTVIEKTNGNITLAMLLARHANIQTTQRYMHISDQKLTESYAEVFDREA